MMSDDRLERLRVLREVHAHLATQAEAAAQEMRDAAVSAVREGVQKSTVARTLGITRPTLDKWIKASTL